MIKINNKLEKILEVIDYNKESNSKIKIRNSFNPFNYINPFKIKRIAVVDCGNCNSNHKHRILTLFYYHIFENKILKCPKCKYEDFISYKKVVE